MPCPVQFARKFNMLIMKDVLDLYIVAIVLLVIEFILRIFVVRAYTNLVYTITPGMFKSLCRRQNLICRIGPETLNELYPLYLSVNQLEMFTSTPSLILLAYSRRKRPKLSLRHSYHFCQSPLVFPFHSPFWDDEVGSDNMLFCYCFNVFTIRSRFVNTNCLL